MSDASIQLSNELITELIEMLGRYDANAEKDRLVVLQYLAGIMGTLVADYPGSDGEREELLTYLQDFIRYVVGEQKRHQEPAQSPAPSKGQSHPTDDPAVGIWKPD